MFHPHLICCFCSYDPRPMWWPLKPPFFWHGAPGCPLHAVDRRNTPPECIKPCKAMVGIKPRCWRMIWAKTLVVFFLSLSFSRRSPKWLLVVRRRMFKLFLLILRSWPAGWRMDLESVLGSKVVVTSLCKLDMKPNKTWWMMDVVEISRLIPRM